MKMVSAAKLAAFDQQAIQNSRPYSVLLERNDQQRPGVGARGDDE